MLVCELVCVRIRAFFLFFFVVCRSRYRVGFLCLCVCVFFVCILSCSSGFFFLFCVYRVWFFVALLWQV